MRRAPALASLPRLAFALASLSGAPGCGAPHVDEPRAPDMAELLRAYEAPDATFDPGAAQEVALAIAVTDQLLARTELHQQLVGALTDTLTQARDLSELRGDGVRFSFEAGGYMRITRVCPGWARPARPDRAANGALVVTATFSERGLDPIVWGTAEACRYRVGDVPIALDGADARAHALGVYIADASPGDDVRARTLLVDLDLVAAVDGERLPLDLDFQTLAGGALEYRIPRPDGSLIARVGAGDAVTLRAANGTFECSAELECDEASAAGAR